MKFFFIFLLLVLVWVGLNAPPVTARCTPDELRDLRESGMSPKDMREYCSGSDSNRSSKNEDFDNRQRRNSEDDDLGSSQMPRRLPNYCCTQAGRLGPYPNPGIPPNAPCYGTHPIYGVQLGYACY